MRRASLCDDRLDLTINATERERERDRETERQVKRERGERERKKRRRDMKTGRIHTSKNRSHMRIYSA